MKIRATVISLLLVTVMLFTGGCARFGVEIPELIVPPESEGELYEIRQALYAFTGKKEITLRYPKSGDWRSAFVIYDVDKDGQNEAVAFYSTTSNENTNIMHINLITKLEGKWISVSDHEVECSSVESIAFSNIGSESSHEIVVCWNVVSSSTNKLAVYRFDKGGLTQMLYENYSVYSLCDIYGSEENELVIIANDTIAKQAAAKVFYEDRNGLRELGSVATDNRITEYGTPVPSKLSDGTPALFADGKKGTEGTVTEVIYVNEQGEIKSLFAEPNGENLKTFRVSGAESLDINGDGALDVPLLKELPGIRGETDQNSVYLTEWCACDKKEGLIYLGSAVMNYTDGYRISVDDGWKDILAVERSADMSERIFYEYNADMGLATHELFRIRILPKEHYDPENEAFSDYFRIASNEESVILGKLNRQNGWGLSEQSIRDRFAFINS